MTTSSSDQRRRLSGHEHSLNGYGANADRTTLVTPFGARGSNPHGLKHRASCQYVVALFFEVSGAGNAGRNYMCRGFDPRQTANKSVAQWVEQLRFLRMMVAVSDLSVERVEH